MYVDCNDNFRKITHDSSQALPTGTESIPRASQITFKRDSYIEHVRKYILCHIHKRGVALSYAPCLSMLQVNCDTACHLPRLMPDAKF